MGLHFTILDGFNHISTTGCLMLQLATMNVPQIFLRVTSGQLTLGRMDGPMDDMNFYFYDTDTQLYFSVDSDISDLLCCLL